MVDAVETRFVALEDIEFLGFGQFGEGGFNALEFAYGIALGVDAIVEHLGFDGPEAAQFPVGRSHFFEETEFHSALGIETIDVLLKQFFEVFPLFIFEDDTFGEEAVPDSVEGGAAFPFLSYRAARHCPVGF